MRYSRDKSWNLMELSDVIVRCLVCGHFRRCHGGDPSQLEGGGCIHFDIPSVGISLSSSHHMTRRGMAGGMDPHILR